MFSLAALLVLAIAAPVKEDPAAALERAFTTLESLGYSGGLAVVEDGEPILERGFGIADRATGAKVTTESIFDCGSITKQFTAAAILALEAAGKLSVEDPIGKYFDSVPEDKAGITIHHLLTHSAGLPGAIGHDEEPIDRDAFVARAFATPLSSAPGEQYAYSNVGFSLLAMIAETVAGKPYEAFLRDRLFAPLGIETAGYVLPKFELSSVAKIYDGELEWGRVYQNHWLEDGPGWHLRGNGGIHLRLADMMRWVAALQNDTVLPEAQRTKMFAQQIDEGNGESFYGYGWVIERGPRGKIIHHNGGNLIFSANVRFVPAIERCVFVVSTQKDWNADDLMEFALSILDGDDDSALPDVVPLAKSELDRLAGDYETADGLAVNVAVRGSLLRLVTADAATDALFFAPDDATRERYSELAKRVDTFVRAAIDGDYGPLCAELGRRRSLEETGSRFREMLDHATSIHGELETVRVVGVRPLREYLAVWLEFDFLRGKEFTAYAFDGDIVIGQVVTERGPTLDLAHVGDGAFESFSLQADAPKLRLKFATTAEGKRSLVLRDGVEFTATAAR